MTAMFRPKVHWIGLSILISAGGLVRAMGADCAVSDQSVLSSEDGCMVAFVYNQEGDHRLVVLDEKDRHRYEAALDDGRMAPFWEGGKVYVLGVAGDLQGFSIHSGKLVAEKPETIVPGVVRQSQYAKAQHRLFFIQTKWDNQRKIFYELAAMDFRTRKVLWRRKIKDPGLIRIMEQYVCVMGLKHVQAYNCDTGEKLGETQAVQAAAN